MEKVKKCQDPRAFYEGAVRYSLKGYSEDFLKKVYRALLLPRLIEERMLLYLRQGRISKWFSAMGQEAISVGATLALDEDEFILTMHRNLGVFTTRGFPLVRLFAQLQGKRQGFTKGRDRSFHFGYLPKKLIGMISHLGAQLGVACGVALGEKLEQSGKIVLAFTGDGGTSEGDFHEALNLASVWELPVLFFIENNGYAISTPVTEQYRARRLSDRAIGYGIFGETIDGNNVLEVYEAVRKAKERILEEGLPVLLEGITFRMRGHEEASGTKYVPRELLEFWREKDPVLCFEKALLQEKVLTEEECHNLREKLTREIEKAWEEAEKFSWAEVSEEEEEKEVYPPKVSVSRPFPKTETKKMRFVDAIRDGLDLAMSQDPKLILMGQDIAEYGGVFKVTEGFVEKYGKERVRNTPVCESAPAGACLGLSAKGYRAVLEMQFADFVSCAFNQIVNNLAKVYYRWGLSVKVVIRLPCGAGIGAGPFHSQTMEAWFLHVPGLKIVYPAFPSDAKGLLLAALEEEGPVLFFEHKALYRSVEEEVPKGYYTLPLGKGKIVQEGEDLTVVTYGMGVHWVKEVAKELPFLSLEILDLRTLLPWDQELVFQSVRKTGKVLVLHEANQTGGVGAEIASTISEECFPYLDGPVMRLGSLDTPIPFAPTLEKLYLARSRLKEKLLELWEF